MNENQKWLEEHDEWGDVITPPDACVLCNSDDEHMLKYKGKRYCLECFTCSMVVGDSEMTELLQAGINALERVG